MESSSPIYTDVSTSAAESRAALRSAAVCCDSLAELRYQPLNIDQTKYYTVNAESQAYSFSSGKSFVQGFRIPNNLERSNITLTAVADATVFVPTVLILDQDFRVSRAIPSSRFIYTPSGFMESQRLTGRFHIERQRGGELTGERYFVVFTTDADLRGSTKMISEARLYARSRGLVEPRLPEPVAAHAATGVFRLSVGDLTTITQLDTEYVNDWREAERQMAPSVIAPIVAPTPAPRGAPKADPAFKPGADPAPRTKAATADMPMLSETQAMYDSMIRNAVRDGEMDRAWRLVQEAARAGSTTARNTFLQSVERK